MKTYLVDLLFYFFGCSCHYITVAKPLGFVPEVWGSALTLAVSFLFGLYFILKKFKSLNLLIGAAMKIHFMLSQNFSDCSNVFKLVHAATR